jgi:CHAT domain-containing protein
MIRNSHGPFRIMRRLSFRAEAAPGPRTSRILHFPAQFVYNSCLMPARFTKLRTVSVGVLWLVLSSTAPPLLRPAARAGGEAVPGSRQIDAVFGRRPNVFPAALKARRYAEVILACLNAIERDPGDAASFFWLAQALEQQGESSGSSAILQVAARLDALARDHPDEINFGYGLGLLEKAQGNFARARILFEDAISRGASFWPVYQEYVTSYRTKSDLDAIAGFLGTLLDSWPSDPLVLQAAGRIAFYRSEFPEALGILEQARALFHEEGDTAAEGRCLVGLSEVLTYSNDFPGAFDRASQGLKNARRIGDRWLEIEALERCAFAFHDMGEIAKADDTCREALALSRESAYRTLESLCLRTTGVIEIERGNLARAEDLLDQAAGYYRRTFNLRSQAVCLYWLTIVHKHKGDYSRAMADSREALEIGRQIDFKTGEAFSLTEIGDIYLQLGDYAQALEYNKQALGIIENPIGKWSREECLNTIGYVYAELNDYQKALEYFRAAFDYIESIGLKREEARCLYNIGFAAFKLGDFPQAFECFSKSLAAAGAAGHKLIQIRDYVGLGNLHRLQGAWKDSRRAYERAREIGAEIGQPNVVWEAYAGLGALHAARKEYEPAVASYKKAVGIIEDLRVQLLLREHSSRFFESKVPLYESLVNVLFEKEEAAPSPEGLAECFAVVEKARARSFLDDLQKSRIDFDALSKEEKEALEAIQRRISRASGKLMDASLGGEARAELRDEMEKANDDFLAFIEAARARYSFYAFAAYREPRRLSEIRERLLDGETGLIEFFVAEDRLYAFFVTINGLDVRRLSPEESRETLQLADDYVRLVSSRDLSGPDIAPSGNRLYKALLGGVPKKDLAGLKNLIVVPDRALNYLPFETLVPGEAADPGRAGVHFLLEDYRISYAPSASTLVSILIRGGRPEAGMDLLSVGDPVMGGVDEKGVFPDYDWDRRFVLKPLAFASTEIRSISSLIDRGFRTTMSRGDAREDTLKSLDLAGYKILHFATHGLLDENAAGRSALVLTRDPRSSEDGFLRAGEIYNLKLNADLVVLSACQTARGKMGKGEGIQGLARAFFCAGSKSVVASLWNVGDRSTARFMKAFYRGLAGGKPIQEAVRAAKVEMYRSGAPPCGWAAFVLIGEGNRGIALHPASSRSGTLHF